MKRDYNIRQITSKKDILVRSRQQSLKYLPSHSQSRVLTQPTELTSSLLKLSQPASKLPSRRQSLDKSLQKHPSQPKCSWCYANRSEYLDVITSIESTLTISKQWIDGSITSNQMLKIAQTNISNNEVVKEIQQLVLQLMHDIESLSKIDIEKLVEVEEFEIGGDQETIYDKISEARSILDQLRGQFCGKVKKRSYFREEGTKDEMQAMMISNLKARLGFVLRQYKQLKQESKMLKGDRERQKQRQREKQRQKQKKQDRSKQKDRITDRERQRQKIYRKR